MSLPKDDAPRDDGLPRRLIERGARGDGEAWGIELLRDAAPTSSSSFRKQRLRAALGQRAVRRAPFALRPAIIVGVLGAAAAASAALGHWPSWIQKAHRQMTATETTALKSKVAQPTTARRAEDVRVVAQADVHEDLASPGVVTRNESSVAPVVLARPFHVRRVDARAPSSQSGSTTPPPPPRAKAIPAVRTTEDTAAVSQATRALRSARDPALARALAKQYLDQYPNGALAEEALAISIEAAVAHHDADAATLAARYLRLYPSGAFRARALRAAASP